jgi:hypothetical protein
MSPITAEAPPLRAALDERRPLLLAMPDEDVDRRPKVDASIAAEIVLAAMSEIARHKDAVMAKLGPEAGARIDALPVVARAAKQADVELTAAAGSRDLGAMEADLRAEHQLLVTDAQSLVNRKRIDPLRLRAARGTMSHRQLIHSTLVLIALLREHWARIEEVTPLTPADLGRIEAKATRMLTRIAVRERGTRTPEAELRARALTDLVRRYDEVRRMVWYVRWHEGDADEIAPSLFARRTTRSRPGRSSGLPVAPALGAQMREVAEREEGALDAREHHDRSRDPDGAAMQEHDPHDGGRRLDGHARQSLHLAREHDAGEREERHGADRDAHREHHRLPARHRPRGLRAPRGILRVGGRVQIRAASRAGLPIGQALSMELHGARGACDTVLRFGDAPLAERALASSDDVHAGEALTIERDGVSWAFRCRSASSPPVSCSRSPDAPRRRRTSARRRST